MQVLSDIYEIAQEQMEERRKKQRIFYLWLSFFVMLVLLSLLGPEYILRCTLPTAGITAFFTLLRGSGLYFNSPARTTKRIAQEMRWLFGEDWEAFVDTNTYAFALSRVRIRQHEQLDFWIHCLVFIPVNLFFVAPLVWLGIEYREPSMVAVSALTLVWLPLLIRHARNALPGSDRLARREREGWETLQLHLNQLRPDKQKRKGKPKRETRYRLADDGELVEETEESEPFDGWDEEPNSDASARP